MKAEPKTLSLADVCLRMQAAELPAVFIHKNPDGDCVGSGAALCRLFSAMGKPARLVCADPIPARLRFLCQGIDTALFPEDKPYTVFAVDVASPAQLGTLAAWLDTPLAPSVMIDHHERGTPFCDAYVDPSAAAAGEIVLEIAKTLWQNGQISDLGTDILTPIYAAIASDTGCLRFENTTPKALRCAAELIERGVCGATVNRLLFDSKTQGQIKAEGIVAARLQTAEEGRIAYVDLPLSVMCAQGLCTEDFETAIDIVRSLAGAEIAVLVKETKEGTSKVSLRSVTADVAAFAARFGGGGHKRAAGYTVPDPNCAAVAGQAIQALIPLLSEN